MVENAKPPSRFHDEAYRRDPGHDALQAEFFAFFRSRVITYIPANAKVSRKVEAEGDEL
jgi:hypothetical protein